MAPGVRLNQPVGHTNRPIQATSTDLLSLLVSTSNRCLKTLNRHHFFTEVLPGINCKSGLEFLEDLTTIFLSAPKRFSILAPVVLAQPLGFDSLLLLSRTQFNSRQQAGKKEKSG